MKVRTEPVPSDGTRSTTWPWLLLAVLARGYLVLLLALVACAVAPSIVGLSGSVVSSGSMLPTVRVGDVALARSLPERAAVPLGHVITFIDPARPSSDQLVLHRLVGVNDDGTVVTKGDANALPDSTPLARNDIVGEAGILVPWIGLPAFWIRSGALAPLTVWLIGTLLAVLVEALAATSERTRRCPGKRRGAPAAGLALLVAFGVWMLPGAPVVSVTAAFSGTTTSVGNSWSVPAAAPAVRLSFTKNPSSSTGGIAFGSQPSVAFLDAAGKVTSRAGSVALSLTSAGSATLTCSDNPVTSVAGISTFVGCRVDKVGTYTLTASSGALTGVSQSFVVSKGPGDHLLFTATPGPTRANTTFPSPVGIAVVDAGNNVVTSTAAVTLTLTSPQKASLICGTNPKSAKAGQVVFAGCRIDVAGTYSLTARSTSLAPATSASFVVSGPALPLLTCQSATLFAIFGWTPTPFVPTQYRLYVDGTAVSAIGADGFTSSVQVSTLNVPASTFPQGTVTVEVRKVGASGSETVIGDGTLILGPAGLRSYVCG